MARQSGANDLERYVQELATRLPGFAASAANVPPGEVHSVEWLGQLGTALQAARKERGFSRKAIAETMGVDIDSIRLVEQGFGTDQELTSEWIGAYTSAIGVPELHQQLMDRFFN